MKDKAKRTLIYVVYLTENCNLRCRYCYVKRKTKTMLWNTAKQAIDFVLSLNYKPTIIAFFGGEPLLEWKLIKRVVEYIKSKDKTIRFDIATNVTLLNKEILKYFKTHKFSPTLSFDGVKVANDKERVFEGDKGSFDIIDKKLNFFKGYPHKLQIRITFTPNTIKYLANSIQYVIKKGLADARINIMPAIDSHKWTEDDFRIFKEQIFEIALIFLKNWKENKFINICSNEDVPMGFHLINLTKKGNLDNEFCGAGRNILAVSVDGKIYPCYVLAGLSDREKQKFFLGDVWKGITFPQRMVDFSRGKVNPYMSCLAWNALLGNDPYKSLTVYSRIYDAWVRASNYVNEIINQGNVL
jgi:uncharacterized protein